MVTAFINGGGNVYIDLQIVTATLLMNVLCIGQIEANEPFE